MRSALVFPRLLSGEYVLGHIGRSLMVNSLSEEQWFECVASENGLLGTRGTGTAGSRHVRAKVMSQCADTEVSKYLERATSVPFIRAGSRTGTLGKARGHRRRFNLHGEPFSLKGGISPRFCRECVAADRRSLGYAYWRRAHQRPGAVACREHSRPLEECFEPTAFHHAPGACSSRLLRKLAAESATPAVGRFNVLLDALGAARSANTLEETARHMTRNLGPLDVPATQGHLSRLIERVFPSDWLNYLFEWQENTYRRRKNNREFTGWNFNSVLGLGLIGAATCSDVRAFGLGEIRGSATGHALAQYSDPVFEDEGPITLSDNESGPEWIEQVLIGVL